MSIKKIAIVGPESTGKSTLAKKLAKYFNTVWAKEYAREFLENNGTNYTFENLYEIAKGQLEEENQAMQKAKEVSSNRSLVILDTNLLVIKIWSEFVFNKCDNRILREIAQRKYDGYLLCNTDVPWVKDNLREYPNIETREKLFLFYKEELTEQQSPWIILHGNYEQRETAAIDFINKTCGN